MEKRTSDPESAPKLDPDSRLKHTIGAHYLVAIFRNPIIAGATG
jgi:hypothetical protein